ncbi:hypothetical protein [Oerskovia flava]|uniref:hypothetical protein n=1 Tax=Oerskovia flava TaxID=2986422 RepID=UPI00223F24F1|nr:hypothetical protein [Oerskovia sp. JB1-3-2]
MTVGLLAGMSAACSTAAESTPTEPRATTESRTSSPPPQPSPDASPSAEATGTPDPGEPADVSQHTVVGYEGWWSMAAMDDEGRALLDEYPNVVLVDSSTGAIINAGAIIRGEQDHLPIDESWPQDAVVVLDANTLELADSFRIDEYGSPVRD